MRTNVYIDGFNLYYGSLKDTPYKWLDLKKLAEGLLNPENKIQKIKLFTANVKPTKNDPTVHQRQSAYLRALKHTIPEIEIIYGHFLQHAQNLPLARENGEVIYNKKGKPRFVTICKREEKGSDVNLAVHFLNDAWHDRYDCGVIISNDSDLAESIRLVKQDMRKTIGVISPYQTVSKELQKYSCFQRMIRPQLLAQCQLPEKIPHSKLTKPQAWNVAEDIEEPKIERKEEILSKVKQGAYR